MNSYRTNYKTVISITEEGQGNFKLDLSKTRDRIKARLLERLNIIPRLDEYVGGVEVLDTKKEVKSASYSCESEILLDTYWTISRIIFSDLDIQKTSLIGSIGMNVGKALTDDNFKVILISIDFNK